MYSIGGLGAIQVLLNTFSWKFDHHPPPRNANNVEPYTFVRFFRDSWRPPTPPPTATIEIWMAPYCGSVATTFRKEKSTW